MSAAEHTAAETIAAAFDRSAEERNTPGLVDALRADPTTRVLVVHDDRAPVADGALGLLTPDAVPDGAEWAFLGRAADGSARLVAAFPATGEPPVDAVWGSFRAVAGRLGADDADLFVEGLSLGRWLVELRFCAACGSSLTIEAAGWSRRCLSCRREHFPRTDPAVIVAVTSARDPDRLLLGSNAQWGQDRFSCFAGFVEAGESLEATVERELAEECGVRVGALQYRASQPWPYPRSLMLGFWAVALDDDDARADGEEIAEVRWFTRAEVGEALDRGHDLGAESNRPGELLLPGPASIAHRLIADWHAGAA